MADLSAPPLLEARGLTRRFGALEAVSELSLSLHSGERFGLLGPNGAGKTTTISMLVGALAPDSGEVLLTGERLQGASDPKKARIGFVPQELALYDDLSAADNLAFFGALYGLHGKALAGRISEALEIAGLSERAKSRVRTFSGGMKRRLNIAAALLHQPALLILDEPTVGVDPQSRNAIFETLERLNADRGVTLLYTTHYMEEVERLCQRIAVMDHGRIVACGTLAELRARLSSGGQSVSIELAPHRGHTLGDDMLTGVAWSRRGDIIEIFPTDLARDTAGVLEALAQRDIPVVGVSARRPTLEDVFLHLTGKSLRDG